jgi:hypothetical protein
LKKSEFARVMEQTKGVSEAATVGVSTMALLASSRGGATFLNILQMIRFLMILNVRLP